MNATTLNLDRRTTSAKNGSTSLTGELYRFHGYRVFDAANHQIGLVGWVWPDSAQGSGEFIGVHFGWLRGTARAIPAHGAYIDTETATIRVAYSREHVRRARRYSIDRDLTVDHRSAIRSHYGLNAMDTVGTTQAHPQHARAWNSVTVALRRDGE